MEQINGKAPKLRAGLVSFRGRIPSILAMGAINY
jgi:hypothetical protein